jgi:small subunit ribosomal protein S2
MPSVELRDLLAAGVHFGHQTQRWNPKMKRYIFGERNRVHIINLKRTLACLGPAMAAIHRSAAAGKPILFVGTKIQARDIIREEATRCGQHYVTERWLGGMLTNFRTIRISINRLKELDKGFETGEFENRTKKEQVRMRKERDRLERTFAGIKEMNQLPGVVFAVDTRRERIAVAEANRLGIPVVGVVDTNADPDVVDYAIPGNDDAIRAIRLFAGAVADTALEAKAKDKDAEKPEPAEKPQDASADDRRTSAPAPGAGSTVSS